MPREFENLSKEVSEGAQDVEKSLDGIVGAAERADSAHAKLSDTQKSSLQISQKFSSAIGKVNRGLIHTQKMSASAASGIGEVAKVTRGAVVAMTDLSQVSGSAGGTITVVSKDTAGLAKNVETAEKKTTLLTKSVGDLSDNLKTAGKHSKLKLKVPSLGDMVDSVKLTKEIGPAAGTAADAISKLAGEQEALSKQASEVAQTQKDVADSVGDLTDAVEEQAKGIGSLLRKQYQQGAQDAESFAGGIGATQGVAIGAGVAVFYLAQKVGELSKQFQQGVADLKEYNVQLALAERSTLGFGASGLAKLKDELNLTRAQALEFYGVVRSGTNELGITAAEITSVAKALQGTFGGDPTKRLGEFVELLKEIPTLDADLSVTASLDDEASAIFGLAKRGKIGTVIDLQAAGLLGGGAPIEVTAEDAALLNAAQKTEKTQEDIYDTMRQFYPSWGPMFGAIADNTFKGVAAIGGLVAITGAMKVFLGRGQKKTTKAVRRNTKDIVTTLWKTSGQTGKLFKKVPRGRILGRGLRRAPQRAMIKMFGKGGLGGAIKKLIPKGITKSVTGGLASLAKGAAITTAVFTAVGIAADFLSNKFDSAGMQVTGSTTKMVGELAKFGGVVAGFATLGSIIPGVGTAVGALIGVLVGLVSRTDMVGAAVEDFGKDLQGTIKVSGKEIPKFNDSIRNAGAWLQGFGAGMKESINNLKKGFMVGVKSVGRFALSMTKMIIPIDAAIQGFKNFSRWAMSDEYRKAFDTASEKAAQLNIALGGLAEESNAFSVKLSANRKRLLKSGLALQGEMKSTKAAFESARFELVNFRKEIAQADIGNLSEIGGTAQQFARATSEASAAMTAKFKMATDALAERRAQIAKNTKLEGEQRQQALADLHKRELDAVREFAEGVKDLTNKLLGAPDIIEAGLKAELKGLEIEAGLEAGTIDTGELTGQVEKAVGNLGTELTRVIEQEAKAVAEIGIMRDQFGKNQIRRTKALQEQFAKMDDDAKDFVGTLQGIREVGGKLEIDPKAAGESIKKVDERIAKLKKEMDGFRDSIPKGSPFEFMEKAAKGEEQVKGFADKVTELQSKIEGATERLGGWRPGKAAEDVKKYSDALEVVQKEQAKAIEEQANAQKGLKAEMEKAAKQFKIDLSDKEFTDVFSQMESINRAVTKGKDVEAEELLSQLDITEKTKKVIMALRLRVRAAGGEFDKLNDASEDLTELVNLKEFFRSAADDQKDNVQAAEAQKKFTEERLKIQREISSIQELLGRSAEVEEVKNAERRLSALQEAVAVAKATGDGVEAITAVLNQEESLFRAQLAASKAAVKSQEQIVAVRKKALSDLIAGGADSTAVDEADRALGRAKEALAKRRKEVADIVDSIAKVGDGIDKALEELQDTFTGRRIAIQFDLSDALAESAKFSDDMARVAKESTNIAIAAAREQAEIQKRAVEKALQRERKGIEDRAALKPADEAERIREEGEIALNAKRRAEYSKIETEQKRKVLDAAAKEASLQREELEIRESGLQDEMSFLSDMGSNWRRIMEIQGEMVGLAKERLTIAENELETAKLKGDVSGMELQRLTENWKKAQRDVARAAVGVQKDIYEKLIGRAFGEIRGGVGARRGRTEAAAMLGIGRTRAVTRAGLFARSGDAGKTIAQRSIERQIAGLGAGGAKKLTQDQKLEKAVRGNVKSTDKVASNTASTAQSSKSTNNILGTRGSAFVHDEGAHGLLNSLLAVAKEMAVGIMSVEGETAGAASASERLDEVIRKAAKDESVKSAKVEAQLKKITTNTKKTSTSTADSYAQQEARFRAMRIAETENPLAGPVNRRIISGEAERSVRELSKTTKKASVVQRRSSKIRLDLADMVAAREKATLDKRFAVQAAADKRFTLQRFGKSIIGGELAILSGVRAKQKKAGMEEIEKKRAATKARIAAIDEARMARRKGARAKFARLEAAKARLGGGLGGPAGVRRLGGPITGLIGGDIGSFAGGPKNIKKMTEVVEGELTKRHRETFGGAGIAKVPVGAAGPVGAPGAAGAPGKMTAEDARAVARAQTGIAPGTREASAFGAKAGLATVSAGGGDGGATSMPNMKITGQLTIHGNMANLVAEVVNTAEVRKSLQKGGVMYS